MKKASVKFGLMSGMILGLLLFSNYSGARTTASVPVKVAEILTPKSFRIASGEVVRLACIQAPNIQEDSGKIRLGQPLGEEAKRYLDGLVRGQEVTLTPEPQLLDRHGRLVSFVQLSDGRYAQNAMLSAGMALVYPFADCRKHLPELLAAEAVARKKAKGIWGHDYWKPAEAETMVQEWKKIRASARREAAGGAQAMGGQAPLTKSEERYQLVTGVVRSVASAGGNWYLNFGEDYKTDFTAFIRADDYRKEFKKQNLKGLTGKKLLLRGWVHERDGVMMEVGLPEQMEVLP